MLLEYRLKGKYILLMINHFENRSLPIYYIRQGDHVFGSVGLSVCLSVCLFVLATLLKKSYERIVMKCYGGVQSGNGTGD